MSTVNFSKCMIAIFLAVLLALGISGHIFADDEITETEPPVETVSDIPEVSIAEAEDPGTDITETGTDEAQGDEIITGWVEIDGDMYFYGPDGEMYKDRAEWIDGYNYRFGEDGRMVTGWYTEDYYNMYYYHEDGKAASGLTAVDGDQYYFSSYGCMARYTTVYDSTLGELIAIGYDGVVSATAPAPGGWAEFNGHRYYVEDNELVTNDFRQIDGYTYFFDHSGMMLANTRQWMNGNQYRFDASGHMTTGWFYDTNNLHWYYYLSNGLTANGVLSLNGKLYYFYTDGSMAFSTKIVENNTLYVIDPNGVATAYKGANGWVAGTFYVKDGKVVTGWEKISGYWYYFSANGAYKNGTYMIDGKTYYFDTSGAMKTGWVNTINGWIFADSSGALKTDEWMKSAGKWYYFNGIIAATDILNINGKNHLFNSDASWVRELTEKGKWIKNDKYWYYIKPDGSFAINEVCIGYGFDYYGRMVTDQYMWNDGKYSYFGSDGKEMISCWLESYGTWYYFDETGLAVRSAWKKVGSKHYYFDGYGRMVTGAQIIDSKLYHFNNSGAWDGVDGVSLSNGWNLANGKYYYYTNGSLITDQLKTINGKQYYFDHDGVMAWDGVYFVYADYRYHIFGRSGAMLKSSWYKDRYGNWYYADNAGNLPSGLLTVNGKQYYFFDGLMAATDVLADGTYYAVSSSGAITDIVTASGTGWKKISDGWLYCKDGQFAEDMLKVNGSYYYFINGKMQTDRICDLYGYYGTDGKLVRTEGWVKDASGQWFYLIDGTQVSGSRYINGKWYYLGQRGTGSCAVSDEIYFTDGAFYKYAGASGGRTKLDFKEGWNKYGSDWYYVDDGDLVIGETRKIGSKYYYFDLNGKMNKTDVVVTVDGGVKYLQTNGTFLKNAWKKLNGTWYYFGPDGNALEGVWTIDGVRYDLKLPE